jgi:predicted Zn-dependent peptidase
MHNSIAAATALRAKSEKGFYQKTVLDNGIRLVTEAIPYVRSVSIGVWANVGSRDETAKDNGISHFLEHMVFKGTQKRSFREIARSIESLGGYLNAFTTKEQTCFYARVLDTHIVQAVDVLSDMIQHATFKKEEVEKEKLVVLEELKNAEDDPEDIIHDYFEKALFPEHSLGFPIIGNEPNLRGFRREDLQAYIATHYSGRNIVVAAAGNLDHNRMVDLVKKYFKDLPDHITPASRQQPNHKRSKSETAEYPQPINQAHVCMGLQGYSIRHRDRYPLLLLNTLLGEGMSSRLHQAVREKHGLAYSVYSFLNMLSDTGSFGTYFATDRNKVDDAIALVNRELGKLRDKPVPRAELERTKSQIKGTMMLGLENMSGRMTRLGSSELYFESYIPLDSVLRSIDAVSSEAIHRVANGLFKEDQFSTVIIRPTKTG